MSCGAGSDTAPQSDRHMPVALYLRVSTEEQRERQSIVTQRDFVQRYCELHQLPVYEIFADDGVSGTVPIESRPAGKRVLAAARQGKFDQLLVFKLDRLGRETRLILNSVAELENHGVRTRSMTEEFDTATATGRLMLTMLSGFAAHEREVIRERSVAGTNRCAEAGAWLGGVVTYANRTYMGEHRFGKRTKNPNRKVIVRAVPAIVTEETWNRAQQVLRSNQIMARRNGRTPFLLRGLIKCGLCGLTFSGARASARQPDHYY